MKDRNGFNGLIFEVYVFSQNKLAFWGKEDKSCCEGTPFMSWRCFRNFHKWGPLLISWGPSYSSFNYFAGNFLEKLKILA